MLLTDFIRTLLANEAVSFAQSIAVINEYYYYQPTSFKNGLDEHILVNAAGANEGSCKIFAFAQLNTFKEQQTLRLFGDYYQQVLATPEQSDHQNIRHFMRYGWHGITFSGVALTPKN